LLIYHASSTLAVDYAGSYAVGAGEKLQGSADSAPGYSLRPYIFRTGWISDDVGELHVVPRDWVEDGGAGGWSAWSRGCGLRLWDGGTRSSSYGAGASPKRYEHCDFESYVTDLADGKTWTAAHSQSLKQAKMLAQGLCGIIRVGGKRVAG